MGASLLLVISAAIFSAEDWNKFGYELGNSYKYNYNGVVRTMVNATTSNGVNTESRLLFTTQVEISMLSSCDYVMQLSNVYFQEMYIHEDAVDERIPERSEELQAALTRHALYFSFQNGRIETICPEKEDQEVIHVKKAILSVFQNSMPNLDQDAVVYETDLSGNCETNYQIEDSDSKLIIKKTKNLEACAHRKIRELSWLSVPYSKINSKNSLSLLRSKQRCIQEFTDDLILESSQCEEEHLFQPFSNGDNGAVTYLSQKLEFISQYQNIPVFDIPTNFYLDNLLSNYLNPEESKNNDISSILNLLEVLERNTKNGVEPTVPRLFSQLVHELQNLNQDAMIEVYNAVKNSFRQKKFILDAMSLITTVDGINTMKIFYNQGEISEDHMRSWLGSLIFLKNISLPIIEAVTPLMQANGTVRHKAVLSGSSVVYSYCKKDSNCLNKVEIQRVIDILTEPLTIGCVPSSQNNYNDILLSLKGLGNIGSSSSLEYLRNCYSNMDSPVEIRLAAIAAHRRINCAENDNLEQLEDYFVAIRQNVEVRIASYLAAMQCASYSTFARVKDVLRTEETNQVGSFVWTHLTNLQESSSQWKHNLKNLVQNEFLRNKFSTDMRKYSRNYEVSTFFDSLNTGATMESNVVFTSESYLPKSAMLNFTLDLFGEAVNLFEIGARMEGFEQIVENLFGPDGYFPKESIRNVLESARNKENEPKDKIQELRDSFTSQAGFKEPNGLIYAKIFGNEISYAHFKNIEGIMGNQIDGQSILDTLMKLFRQQNIEYTKSFVFLDSSYKIPTMLGFPLQLAINGTATIGLTVKSKIDLKDLWAQKVALEGKLYPSAAIEIIGTMTVDTLVGKTGLRSVNTLNSNTYLDGHVFIDKGKLVDLKLNVPKKQMDIINIESQAYIVQSDRVYPMDDVTDNTEKFQGCTQKLFSSVTGLQFCYEMRYPNASLSQTAPYFPLTGRFKYSMEFKKTDSFDSYQLRLKTHSQVKNFRPIYAMSLYFDTPNSRIVRKIETSYLLDCEKLSFNATLLSPFVDLEVNSKIGSDFDSLGFILQTKLNNNEILFAKVSLKSTKVNSTWKYEPSAELNYKNRKIVALAGHIDYLQGTKYSANLQLHGISNETITVLGDLHVGTKKIKVTSSIKSKELNGKINAVVVRRPDALSVTAKTTYDYKNYKEQIVSFEFKHNTIKKQENLLLSLNSTQNPSYNTMLSFNMQRDDLYFEIKSAATLLETTWKSHQLFKFLRTNDQNDIALKCAVSCVQKDIDYSIDFSHVKSENVFKVHGLLQLNRIQRLEALINYNHVVQKMRTFDLLLYFPKQSWIINGILSRKTEKEYKVLFESFYEMNEQKKSLFTLTGEYFNSTIGLFQNHTITGKIEIPETRFDTPWIMLSTFQASPDLFLNTAQLRTKDDLYLSHITWSDSSFSSLFQVNDKQIFLINGLKTPDEISLSFGLNIYQHFEMFAQMEMPYKKFRFILFWDKDRDTNQKISVTIDHHVQKGLYVIDLEYPNQKVATALILLPTQVTINVTWGIDSTQRIYLKAGNKVYDIGGIWFATLETPFVYLENQKFQMSYYILPENAELKIDVAWRDQNINLVLSGTKNSHRLSGYLDLNTTIPELYKIGLSVSHIHNNTNGLLKIKNDAAFVFNQHQITGQCIWESRGTNVSSNFEIVSASNIISPITGMLVISNNQSTNYFNSFVNWNNKKVSVDYKFENSQSYIKIKTPFKGLEVIDLDYTLIGEANKLMLEVRVNILKQFNYALLSWKNEDNANVINFKITCPVIGSYQIMFKHSTVFGYLEEYFIVQQGRNAIFSATLYGDLVPILMMNITAEIKFLERVASINIKNSANPLASRLEARWDDIFVISNLKILFEDKTISDLRWDVSSSLLNEDVSCKYIRDNYSYVLAVSFPQGYKFDNVLSIENSYKSVKNVLNVDTPLRSGFVYYFHDLAVDNHSFDYEIAFKMNNNESKFELNYNINNATNFIDAASITFMTPWQHPVILKYSMPKINHNTYNPSLYLEYNSEKMVKIDSLMKLEYLNSNMHIHFDLPYTLEFDLDANYDFNNLQKTIDISINKNSEFIKIACTFDLNKTKGWLNLNAAGREKQFLNTSLKYNLEQSLKIVHFNTVIQEKDKLEFDASTINENNVLKGKILAFTTIKNWERISSDISLTTKEESYLKIQKNNKEMIAKYIFNTKNDPEIISCSGRLLLLSQFELIQNCSIEFSYQGNDEFQKVNFKALHAETEASFKGGYSLVDQQNKGSQNIALESELEMQYFNPNKVLNIDAQLKGKIEVKKLGGKINVVFASNIPKLAMNINANYELIKKGYRITAELLHDNHNYRIQYYLHPSLTEFECLASLSTPPELYGNVLGKLTLLKHNDFIKTQMLFENNAEFYNVSLITKYESILSSETVIQIITPINKYTAVLKNHFSLTQANAKIYATVNENKNEIDLVAKTKHFKSAELQLSLYSDSLKIPTWILQANYDISLTKKNFSILVHDNRGNALEGNFNLQKLQFKIDTFETKNYFLIAGSHQLTTVRDLSISYEILLNGEKIKIELKHTSGKHRMFNLVITTTFKNWNRISVILGFKNAIFDAQISFKNNFFVISANKNALFNNQDVLAIELNKSPVLRIWSSVDQINVTSSSEWANIKLLMLRVSNPEKYCFNLIKDDRDLVNFIVEDIHTQDYFDFSAKLTNAIFPKFSNLSCYFYTNYVIPNNLTFALHNNHDPIINLSYQFQFRQTNYLGRFHFDSVLEGMQNFTVFFKIDPKFTISFEIFKQQYGIKHLYKIMLVIPFESNKCNLELEFPWNHENLSLFLLVRPYFIDFKLKSPLKEWNNIIVKSSFQRNAELTSGEFSLQKNQIFLVSEWSYGYNQEGPLVSLKIQNKFSEEDDVGKILISGKYGDNKNFNFNLEESNNKIDFSYILDPKGMFIKSDMSLSNFLVKQLNLNLAFEKYQNLDAILEINHEKILNLSLSGGDLSELIWYIKVHVNLYENLYFYNARLVGENRNATGRHFTLSFDSKTDNYLFGIEGKAQTITSFLTGNITGKVTGWFEMESVDIDDYEIEWLLNPQTIKINLNKNNQSNFVELIQSLANNKLNLKILIDCAENSLNLNFEGLLDPHHSFATLILTTQLLEVKNLEFTSSLISRENGEFAVHNYLSWPVDLTLDLRTNRHSQVNILFKSPFNEPFNFDLTYENNSNNIAIISFATLGKQNITFSTAIIPDSRLSSIFTSPFIGIKFLNLTCLLNKEEQTAKVILQHEQSTAELLGDIRWGPNSYQIKMDSANTTKMVLNYDTSTKMGNAEMFWGDKILQVTVNLNSNNLLLALQSSFKFARQVKIQGMRQGYNFKMQGMWNEAEIKLERAQLNSSFTVLQSVIDLGQHDKGSFNFKKGDIREQDFITLNVHYPDQKSDTIIMFVTEKNNQVTKYKFVALTPFEMIQKLSSEAIVGKNNVETEIKVGDDLFAHFKANLEKATRVEAYLNVDIPKYNGICQIHADINLHNHGILKVNYKISNDFANLAFDYKMLDGEFESHYLINGTKINTNHTLVCYMRNKPNEQKLGVKLDEYILLYTDTNRGSQMNKLIKIDLPYYKVQAQALFDANLVDKKATLRAFYINEYNVGRIYSQFQIGNDEFLFQYNASDASGSWINSRGLYKNKGDSLSLNLWTIYKYNGIESFPIEFHAIKSPDKISVNLQDNFNINLESTLINSKLYVMFSNNKHSLNIDFKDTIFTLEIISPVIKPAHLKLSLNWSTENVTKTMHFNYYELNKQTYKGSLQLHQRYHPINGQEYLLNSSVSNHEKSLMDFSGIFSIGNITQGAATLIIFNVKNHVYFILNPKDPYMAGITFRTPFLPFGGLTLETGISINGTSLFIFGGTGPSDLLDKGFISLESHKKYILFEASKEDSKILIKYEALSMGSLNLVDLQADLNIQEHSIEFFENFEINSEKINITLNTMFNVLSTGLETKIDLLLPFNFNKLIAELSIPFQWSNDFNPKFVFEVPGSIYSAQVQFRQLDWELSLLTGYQYNSNEFNVTVNLTKPPFPIRFFAEINLPLNQFNHFAVAFARPKAFNINRVMLCYLEILEDRYDLKYMIFYNRDRHIFNITLKTPFETYKEFSLNLEHENDEKKVLKALVFYPGLTREAGFDFELTYKNIKALKLNTTISFPFEIKGFTYGEFNILYNVTKNNNVFHCFSQVNNYNASFNLQTTTDSNLIVFYLDTRIAENRFYINLNSVGNIFDSIDFVFELETPLEFAKILKLFANTTFDLNRGSRMGFNYNAKTILQLEFKLSNGEALLRFDNVWKPFLLEYYYSNEDFPQATGKICWDLNYPDSSQIGGHIIIGQNVSIGLILPTRLISFDCNFFIDKHSELYSGRFSWFKNSEIAGKLLFTNFTINNTHYLTTKAVVTLPFRTFEILDEVETNFENSPVIKSRFTFKWDKNDSSRISFQNYAKAGKSISKLYVPILNNEIVLTIDTSSLTTIPSHMKAQLEYSNDINKRIQFEMHYDKEFKNIFRTERQFILKHPASKIDYSLHFSTTRTPEYTTGNVTLIYMNYVLNRLQQIKSSLKIRHDKFEVVGDIETSKNYISVAGITKSGLNFQGFSLNVQINKKDPLYMEGIYNFKPTGSSVSLSSSYGSCRRYDFYAGLPSKREITIKMMHRLYDNEITDGLFTLKLNNSQILWLKVNWKNELLPRFKSAILEEYSEARFIIEETAQHLIDIIHDDFGHELIENLSELQKKLSSYTINEKKLLADDYNEFVAQIKEGYQSNSFFIKDIERLIKAVIPNIDVLINILIDPIWASFDTLYKGVYATVSDIFNFISSVWTSIQIHTGKFLEQIENVKRFKARAKQILKVGINEAKEALKQVEILFAELLDNIDEYVILIKLQSEEFFEPYLKLLDDCVIYAEQRLAILQMLVLDILDTVHHYILNLRESQQVIKMYALYLNWVEEFHITDILEPIGDIIESILDTIITDVKKIMHDYRPYIDAASEAVFGNYQDINDLPPLTEFREAIAKIYHRTLWIWNYHNLSEAVKNCIHKMLSDFDDYLASLIKLDNNNNDFENILGQSDYIFRPDIGVIEITQPLPVEWEAFDEMPYFEQHPLYHKIKKRFENLIQIQRHHFNDLLNIIKSYTGESSKNLLTPATNNIGMVVGKSNYLTFDKKYYNFAGECSYLLASDFVTNTFSVVINYYQEESVVKKKSIGIISDDYNIEIATNFTVLFNDVETDLPLVMGSLVVTRENAEISVQNSKGLKIICNLYYDFCTIELSGWFFGKTGGLLGTLDNEKVTDMSLPDGNRTSDVQKFVQSWQVGSSKCSNINYADDTTQMNLSPLSTTLFETLCQVFFINVNSPLGQCFGLVDPKPFYEICVNNMKDMINPTMCSSVAAYKAQCEKSKVFIDMPEMCVHCKYDIDLNDAIFDRENPTSVDVVFIKEDSCVNQDYSFFPRLINEALGRQGFYGNQFSVVGYGSTIAKPFIFTSNSEIWNSAETIAMNTQLNSTTDRYNKVSAIDAIYFATNLEFRPGVSKLFILLQCDDNTEIDNLSKLHNLFGEKDITLHVLKFESFNHGENTPEFNEEGHVLYLQDGLDIQDSNIEYLNTTVNKIVSSQITDIYTLLALSTNGTVLSLDNEYQTKAVSESWAKIISKTAKRSPCQRCKCVISSDGTGKVECNRCMSPIVKQLLNEYESNIMEFHSGQDSDEF